MTLKNGKGTQVRMAGKAIRTCWCAAAGAVALLLLTPAAPIQALPPIHASRPDLTLDGSTKVVEPKEFNKACGTAVDSEGDVYVASAGLPAIDVFDPQHNHLTTLTEKLNEPCGLAVDSNGNLYVSDSGNVLKYHPNEYPFVGAPSYGAAESIDASGEAKGIAVDLADNRLYVAKGPRVDTYNSDGNLGIDEKQKVRCFECASGFYKLKFEGSEWSEPIQHNAKPEEVEKALETLSTIDLGDVSVSALSEVNSNLVTFKGKLAHTDLEALAGDCSECIGGTAKDVLVFEQVKGFDGHIGEGDLTEATGVAAYTFEVINEDVNRYLAVADAASNEVNFFSGDDIRALNLRKTIAGVDHDRDPATLDQEFGFGPRGAYLGTDTGNRNAEAKCFSIAGQACTAGHFFVYDDANGVVDEFEATGRFLTQIPHPEEVFAPELEDAEPTAIAVDRFGGESDGTIYVTSGTGLDSKLLAFGPLTAPSRPPRRDASLEQEGIRDVAVDPYGNRYTAVDKTIYVYLPTSAAPLAIKGPKGEAGLVTSGNVADLAVDSACSVYALDKGDGSLESERIVHFDPDSCPPKAGTRYAGPSACETENEALQPFRFSALGVNPANDHLFVIKKGIMELSSGKAGCEILNPTFGPSGGVPNAGYVAVYGANGDAFKVRVFVSSTFGGLGGGAIWALDGTGETLARITGAGSPKGPFAGGPGTITVDQSTGHLLAFKSERGVGEEYEANGAFVTQFGSFSSVSGSLTGIAVDNSAGPNDGNVYVAFDDPAPNTFSLTAFGPLTYGELPIAATGNASGVSGGEATLNGSVDPRGFELTDCHFEYLTEAEFRSNVEAAEEEGHEDPVAEGYGFAGATPAPCAETLEEIGKGSEPLPVHADLLGLDPEEHYRFRLIAANKFGDCEKCKEEAGLFGPPRLSVKAAHPIFYTEAILRAEVDPSGLATQYSFEYLDRDRFEKEGGFTSPATQTTPTSKLPPGDGPVAVHAPLLGLTEGTLYHFRVLVENEAKSLEGPDQTFETQQRLPLPSCPNAAFRAGPSAALPDCRAYELVTPADTRGNSPFATDHGDADRGFNNWLVDPSDAKAGESVAYFIEGTLPGFDGTGRRDPYRAVRAKGEGPHPKTGWETKLAGPSYAQAGESPAQEGFASDQEYSLWGFSGSRLGTPAGFEQLGRGSLGEDPQAVGRFVTAGGAHVIFTSKEHLEPTAAPKGTVAIYDRPASKPAARVVSLKPGNMSFGAEENATFLGTTDDGSASAFKVGGVLYLRRNDEETVEISEAPNTFAGISDGGTHVFFADAVFSEEGADPAGLFVCDIEAGPCVGGAEPPGVTEIAPNAKFVNVPSADPLIDSSAQDNHFVYFTSEEVFAGGEENESNLYVWDDASKTIRFIAVLDPQDFVGLGPGNFVSLEDWARRITAGRGQGRARSATRSTPDGQVLVFESVAQLTPYDNTEAIAEGCGNMQTAGDRCAEIYRYDAVEESPLCISCDPSGAPPNADASLQPFPATNVTTLIPNLTTDGTKVIFQSQDQLLPDDANDVQDVYEWMAQGRQGCKRPSGCLALISSGQSDRPSHLYGMTPDGHDVFFVTQEKLVGTDLTGSPSLYDAREEGGIPDPPTPAPCQGDACQGQGSTPPALPSPASSDISSDGNVPSGGNGTRRCRKGARAALRQSNRAKRLRRGARRAKDKRARVMHRAAIRHARKARRLARGAKRCRARQRARANVRAQR